MESEKRVYERPWLELFAMEEKDIITTSMTPDELPTDPDDGEWDNQ